MILFCSDLILMILRLWERSSIWRIWEMIQVTMSSILDHRVR
jgi:hypothetical protein